MDLIIIKSEETDPTIESQPSQELFVENKEFELLVDFEDNTKHPIYTCDLCAANFKSIDDLNLHITKHFLVYKCDYDDCNAELIGDNMLKYHLSTKHKRRTKDSNRFIDDPLRCEFCDKLYTQRKCLTAHLKAIHQTVFVYCRFCKLKWTSDEQLKQHYETVHTGMPITEPYICPICGHNFNRNFGAFKQHLFIHEKVKRFVCDICGKDFAKKTNLELHIRSHTGEKPFSCQICNRLFSHRANLSSHMRLHTKERPFQCPYCDKNYSHSTDLRRHKRIHEETEKKHKCDWCNYSCYEARFLRKHKKTHRNYV